jgi:hypothetical protein
VTITHPFHPGNGETLDVLRRERRFGEDHVVYLAAAGHTAWLPAAWTSLAEPTQRRSADGDAARFRVDDLIELAELVAGVRT